MLSSSESLVNCYQKKFVLFCAMQNHTLFLLLWQTFFPHNLCAHLEIDAKKCSSNLPQNGGHLLKLPTFLQSKIQTSTSTQSLIKIENLLLCVSGQHFRLNLKSKWFLYLTLNTLLFKICQTRSQLWNHD